MVLQVLSGGEMPFASRVFVGDNGKSIQLVGRELAAGNLGADHLNAGLTLSIASEAKPQGAKLVIGKVAGQVFIDVAAKALDLSANGFVVLVFEASAVV
jgi:hypothetical protein